MTFLVSILLFYLLVWLQKSVPEEVQFFNDECEESPGRICPACNSEHLIKNGSIHNGKPKHQCKNCGRQFVNNPTKTKISTETKQFVDRLLLERISLRGIARAAQVSWSWLQDYVNDKLAHVPRQVKVSTKSKGRVTLECDEMWSFVASKQNEVYIWLAIDHHTREIVGCFVGDRTRKSARQLWASLPDIYQQSAFAYTDFWQAYLTVIAPQRHQAVGKESGLTNRIERLNNTFRQRVSRLVRQSLSFSKNLHNHIGAIWYFIHGYNAELAEL